MSIRLLIAGGGVAGLEAALALRAYAGADVQAEVLEARSVFELPAFATSRAFGSTRRSLPLSALAERAGFRLRRGAVAAVDADGHLVITDAKEAIGYDRLILAIGARRETSADWTLTFTGPEDVASFQRLLARISRGARQGVVTRLAFVVPPGAGWPLPAYELALATARRLDRRGVRDAVRLTLVTAEERPLEVFGARASAAIADDLRSAGITVISGVVETRWSWGRLHLRPAGSVAAERVVGLPKLRGPWIAGVPADADGFIKTHGDGRVVGLRDVYAIGDATTYPVKQGGVGCQHADLVAGAIAAEAGGRDLPPPVEPALRAQLWDDERGRGLSIDLADGRPVGEGETWRTAALWPWHHKVSCRFLSPFLEDLAGHAQSGALPQPMEKPEGRRRWTDT